MSNNLKCIAIAAIAAGASIVHHTQQAAAQEYYAGKTITIVVGLEPGGTSDTFARRFSVYMQRHLPGRPNIVVQNMPGGAGTLATNFVFERAKPDGQTILWGPWDPLSQVLGQTGLRARYEQFDAIGGTGDTRVNYARTSLIPGGLKTPADIVKAGEVIIGDAGASGFSGLFARLSLDVLGVKNRLVSGYKGGTDVFLALQRNEVHFHNTSITTLRSRTAEYIAAGNAIAINYFVPVEADGSFKKSPFITDIPTFPELYMQINGKMPSGPSWDALNWLTRQLGDMAFVGLAPPKTTPEAVRDLRRAYELASSDAEFVADAMKAFKIPFTFVDVESCLKIFKSLETITPEVKATLQKLISSPSSSK